MLFGFWFLTFCWRILDTTSQLPPNAHIPMQIWEQSSMLLVLMPSMYNSVNISLRFPSVIRLFSSSDNNYCGLQNFNTPAVSNTQSSRSCLSSSRLLGNAIGLGLWDLVRIKSNSFPVFHLIYLGSKGLLGTQRFTEQKREDLHRRSRLFDRCR